MHLVLAGATGLVGSAVLCAMLRDPAVTRVSILSRRPVPQAEGHAKAEVILHRDFGKWDDSVDRVGSTQSSEIGAGASSDGPESLRAKLASATGVVWALGISQNMVSAAEYGAITHDFPLAFVRFWAKNRDVGVGTTTATALPTSSSKEKFFVFVSGEGATHRPGLFTAQYGRVKGRTEMELLEMTVPSDSTVNGAVSAPSGFQSEGGHIADLTVYTPRPAIVDPTKQTEIHSFLPRPQHGALVRLATPVVRAMTPLLTSVWPNSQSPTTELGIILTELAKGRAANLIGLRDEGNAADIIASGTSAQSNETNGPWDRMNYAESRDNSLGRCQGVEKGRDSRPTWRGGVLANGELRRLMGMSFNR